MINVDKTKVMAINRRSYKIMINGVLKQVNSFTYFGAVTINNADCVTDIRSRISEGKRAVAAMKNTWSNHSIRFSTKICLEDSSMTCDGTKNKKWQ